MKMLMKNSKDYVTFVKKNNMVLILRLHPYAEINRRKLKRIINSYKNVYWLDMSKEPEVMKLLAIADIFNYCLVFYIYRILFDEKTDHFYGSR